MFSGLSSERKIELVFRSFSTLLVSLAVSLNCAYFLSDPDSSWHIEVGKGIVRTGVLPTTDTLSFTEFGRPWIAKEWLSQVIWYASYAVGGWPGVAAVAAAVTSLLAWVLHAALSKEFKPHYVSALVVVVIYMTSPTLLARPHLFVLPLIVVWTVRIFARAEQNRSPEFWLLLIMVIWSNLNANFLLGFVIAGFGFLQVFMANRLHDKSLLSAWIFFLALCMVASMFTPYGWGPLILSATMAAGGNQWGPGIVEWQAYNFGEKWPISLVLFGLLGATLVFRPRLPLVTALFVVFAFYAFMTHIRFVFVFFLLVPIAVALPLARQFPFISQAVWVRSVRDPVEIAAARHATLIVSIFAVVGLGALALIFVLDPKPPETTAPRAAIAFAKSERISGNVLNAYNFGGPLILEGIPSFIDGRTDQLFLGEFYANLKKTNSATGEVVFRHLLERYNITWTLLPPEDVRNLFLEHMRGWKLAYQDKFAVIYRRIGK